MIRWSRSKPPAPASWTFAVQIFHERVSFLLPAGALEGSSLENPLTQERRRRRWRRWGREPGVPGARAY